jgi:hypothetical protein
MPKASPTAGRQVIRLAHAFSADLLHDEERTFRLIAERLGVGLITRRREVERALGPGGPAVLRNNAGLTAGLLDGWQRSADQARKDVEALARTAASKGLASVRQELTVIEKSFRLKRYRGLADIAAGEAQSRVEELVAAELLVWDAQVVKAKATLRSDLLQQYGAAADGPELQVRLFSQKPAGLRGFGGRGVWWRSSSELNASARFVSVDTSNAARTCAMLVFNEVGATRG